MSRVLCVVKSVQSVTTFVFLHTDPAAVQSHFLLRGQFVFTYIVVFYACSRFPIWHSCFGITWHFMISPKTNLFLWWHKKILGLSNKFIPTKPHTSSAAQLEKSQYNFRRDTHWKVFFADSPIDNDPQKLYVKSKWCPPLDEIPPEMDTRICNFFREING